MKYNIEEYISIEEFVINLHDHLSITNLQHQLLSYHLKHRTLEHFNYDSQ